MSEKKGFWSDQPVTKHVCSKQNTPFNGSGLKEGPSKDVLSLLKDGMSFKTITHSDIPRVYSFLKEYYIQSHSFKLEYTLQMVRREILEGVGVILLEGEGDNEMVIGCITGKPIELSISTGETLTCRCHLLDHRNEKDSDHVNEKNVGNSEDKKSDHGNEKNVRNSEDKKSDHVNEKNVGNSEDKKSDHGKESDHGNEKISFASINFLCIHPMYRKKGINTLLIKKIQSILNTYNFNNAVFTGASDLQFSHCHYTYYHKIIKGVHVQQSGYSHWLINHHLVRNKNMELLKIKTVNKSLEDLLNKMNDQQMRKEGVSVYEKIRAMDYMTMYLKDYQLNDNKLMDYQFKIMYNKKDNKGFNLESNGLGVSQRTESDQILSNEKTQRTGSDQTLYSEKTHETESDQILSNEKTHETGSDQILSNKKIHETGSNEYVEIPPNQNLLLFFKDDYCHGFITYYTIDSVNVEDNEKYVRGGYVKHMVIFTDAIDRDTIQKIMDHKTGEFRGTFSEDSKNNKEKNKEYLLKNEEKNKEHSEINTDSNENYDLKKQMLNCLCTYFYDNNIHVLNSLDFIGREKVLKSIGAIEGTGKLFYYSFGYRMDGVWQIVMV
ncbi:N-myristoyl transferase [Pseudoloma neurophilia]|uniref:Glycylpeptide N-tetradecanoyltransferase n=1 Tax=Pseudoloma neurophilia TaxID=146866 RepID=A0A0R0M0R7_9MICR|nr:N-myristoyl transferase [Pseudoloma neurophilia]